MSIADDMKKLTEDIVASYDVRVKAIGALVKDTHQMLKGFNLEHKEMAEKLSSDLAKFVGGLVKETAALVKKFQAEHKEMAEELGNSLAKGETDRLNGDKERLKAFKGMMSDIRKGVKDIETYVANKLKEFTDAHADMSAELKKELARYVANIVSGTGKLLSGYADERENMAANWQDMVATLAKKRGSSTSLTTSGRPVKIQAGEAVKTVAEAVKKSGKKAKKGKSKSKRKSKKDNWSL